MPNAAFASPTSGTRGLVAVDGRTFPLRSAHLDARAEGGLAETVLTQAYANPHAEPLEVLYTMPLPADGAVVAYTFRLGERVVRGRIEKKETAREAYLRALEEGRTAGLLEQQRADTFVQRLGNLPPGANVEVEIRVLHPLAFEPPGRWTYRFPTVVGVRYHGDPGRVPDAGALEPPRADATGTGVRIGGTLRLDDGSVVPLGEGALDRDVVHAWPAGEASTRARLLEGPGLEGDDGRYALIVVTPPQAATAAHARDLTVLLDASGSMGGDPMGKAKEVIHALLDSLAPHDRIEVIAFSNRPRPLTRGLVAATPRAIEDVRARLADVEAGGATEMTKAFEAAFASMREEAQRQVVLVTDGEIGFESEVAALVRERLPERSRVHVVGIGSSPNRTLTLGASRAGRGVEVLVGLRDDPARAATRLVRATAAPVLTEIRVKGSGVVGIAPKHPRDLFAGEPLRVMVELKPAGGAVVVHGRTVEGPWTASFEAPATLPEGVAGLPLGAFFGREQALDLEAEGVTGDRMREVGLRHRIVTSETSLVAISEDATVDPRDPRRVEKLAVELPEGVSAEGVGYGRTRYPAAMVAFDGLLGVAESMRSRVASPRAALSPRMFDITESIFETVLEIVGRLVRAEGRRLVVEFESPSDRFVLGTATQVEVVFEGVSLVGSVVEDASTRPGVCPEGTTVRLVLDVAGDLPVGKSPLAVTVEMEGGAELLIRIEVPAA